MTQRYPLQWPIGWQRTKPTDRKRGSFSTRSQEPGRGYPTARDITLARAVNRCLGELTAFTKWGRPWRVHPDDAVLSTNLEVRKTDGLPKAGQRAPDDPGAALYFDLDGAPKVVACDRYLSVEQNVAGIAAILSALRALERHGGGIMERAFTGFEALPHLAAEPWYVVLGLPEDAPTDLVRRQYQLLRSENHPDHGGSDTQFNRIVQAFRQWEQANGQG